MFSIISRFLVLLALASAVSWLVYGQWRLVPSFVQDLGFLSVPLIYSYINLMQLEKFILLDRVESMPSASGLWGEVLARL